MLSTFPNPTVALSNVCHVLSPRQYCAVDPKAIVFSLFANAGTVGASAVPPKSPLNLNFPFTVSVASAIVLAATAELTNAVVATAVELSLAAWVTAIVPVGSVGVPVNTGEDRPAYWVLSTLPSAFKN